MSLGYVSPNQWALLLVFCIFKGLIGKSWFFCTLYFLSLALDSTVGDPWSNKNQNLIVFSSSNLWIFQARFFFPVSQLFSTSIIFQQCLSLLFSFFPIIFLFHFSKIFKRSDINFFSIWPFKQFSLRFSGFSHNLDFLFSLEFFQT